MKTYKSIKVIAKCLNRIERSQGIITPQAVVDFAKPKSSPLHKYFQWDDTIAAARYREWQARELIAKVEVKVSGTNHIIRQFVNVSVRDENDVEVQGYMHIENTEKSASLKDQVLSYARSQLLLWKKRFGGYKEFYEVVKAIESL